MPKVVWTDYDSGAGIITPGKRYELLPFFKITCDDGVIRGIDIYHSELLHGRAWNVETVADPAPPARDILAARVTVAGDIADGWRLVAIVHAEPWPWCLVERGTALGRCSPAAFLKAGETIQ